MNENGFTAKFTHVLPIVGSLIISIVCSLILQQEDELANMTLFSDVGPGPLLNAAAFVSAAGIGATMIYFLLKHGIRRLVHLLMGVAFSVLTFSLFVLYSTLLLEIAQIELSGVFITILVAVAVLATVIVLVEIFLRRSRFSIFIALGLAGCTGALLGVAVPFYSAIVVLVALAAYDVVAVFYGPIGKIADHGLENIPGASVAFGNIHVGLGDLTFYSMLVSLVLLSFGWEACLTSVLGVLLGSYLSFKMVEKWRMFPGLPFPIILGLVGGFFTYVLSEALRMV